MSDNQKLVEEIEQRRKTLKEYRKDELVDMVIHENNRAESFAREVSKAREDRAIAENTVSGLDDTVLRQRGDISSLQGQLKASENRVAILENKLADVDRLNRHIAQALDAALHNDSLVLLGFTAITAVGLLNGTANAYPYLGNTSAEVKYTVLVKGAGEHFIGCIKAVRNLKNSSLPEAKNLLDPVRENPPRIVEVATDLSHEDALVWRKTFKECAPTATIELVPEVAS